MKGSVDWKRVAKPPIKMPFKKIENLNYALEARGPARTTARTAARTAARTTTRTAARSARAATAAWGAAALAPTAPRLVGSRAPQREPQAAP